MATTYKSTINVTCRKEHTCVGCGAAYLYLFKRKVTGQASSVDAATAAAQAAALKAVQNEVDMRACPSCGIFQPDMVGAQRGRLHKYLMLPVVLEFAAIAILAATDLISMNVAATASAGILAVIFALHWIVDSRNPNRDTVRNQQIAQLQVDNGLIQLSAAGKPESAAPDAGSYPRTGFQKTAVILMLVAVLVAGLPELVRLASGWALNDGWFPPVVGPGDSAYFYFPTKISSVKGYWNGTVTLAKATDDRGADLARTGLLPELGGDKARLVPFTNNASWGNTISIKSSEKSSSSTLWAGIRFPASADLADRMLDLQLNLAARFPVDMGGNRWQEHQQQFSHSGRLHLSTAGAGSFYKTAFWVGIVAGNVLMLILAFGLVRSANRLGDRALPTRVYPIEDSA
jgi:hypothetical protein